MKCYYVQSFKCIAKVVFLFCLFIMQPWFYPVVKYDFNAICFPRFIFVNSVIVSSIISCNDLYQDFIITYVWYFVSRNSISVLGAIWPLSNPCTVINSILLTYLLTYSINCWLRYFLLPFPIETRSLLYLNMHLIVPNKINTKTWCVEINVLKLGYGHGTQSFLLISVTFYRIMHVPYLKQIVKCCKGNLLFTVPLLVKSIDFYQSQKGVIQLNVISAVIVSMAG